MTTNKETEKAWHIPVMLHETLALLAAAPGMVMVDATLGGGGHAAALLERILPGGMLIGLDRDRESLAEAKKVLAAFEESLCLHKADFGELDQVLARCGTSSVDGILFDLGVSSHQLDSPARGFAYSRDTYLDMRMDLEQTQTAADLLHNLDHGELASILRNYGEEKWAARIASRIVERRRKEKITRSAQLVELIREAIPAAARRSGGHPAKRVFQALRIAVNDELASLQRGLRHGIAALRPGGRIVVIAYHSLEDRMVKELLRQGSSSCICPPGLPRCACGKKNELRLLTKKPLLPAAAEIALNPRAKSARLRGAEKLA